jgi:hypothetical protein
MSALNRLAFMTHGFRKGGRSSLIDDRRLAKP